MGLIDADALANYANNQIAGITANDIMRFPTIDAELVKHGQWRKRMSTSDSLKCTVCGNNHEYETTYCPNCNAKMDGNTNNET